MNYSFTDKIKAWSVHVFTATGMVVGFKALDLAFHGQAYEAFIWLLIAAVIDGIDGTFARLFRVTEVAPRIDGHLIDGVVDCLNYVIVPAVIFYRLEMVPVPLLFPMVAGILYASLFHLGNTKQVTDDYRFLGFPAWWNLVIYYLFILDLGSWPNAVITAVFILLHFLPVRFIYLSRMRQNKVLAFSALFLLLAVNGIILVQYPDAPNVLKIIAVVPLVFLLVLGSIDRELIRFKRLVPSKSE